jgi:hypothetical protein
MVQGLSPVRASSRLVAFAKDSGLEAAVDVSISR